MATSTAPTLRSPEPPRFHSGKAFFWGIVLILAVGFLAWLIIGHYADNFEDLDQKRVKERQDILAKRTAEDAKWLNDPPSYVDKAKGQIRVPIDEAMRMALPALHANKPHPAYPLTQSLPQPAAGPSAPAAAAGSPAPAPVAGQSPTPAQSSPSATPAPAASPTVAATPQAGTAATSTPPPPAANNNALNPGNPPPNGPQPQPSPVAPGNIETSAGSPTPSGAQSQPLTNPTPQATPPVASSQNTPSPNPKEPGAPPSGTP